MNAFGTPAQPSPTAVTMDGWLQMHHQPWFPLVEARPDGVFRYTCGEPVRSPESSGRQVGFRLSTIDQ